MNFENIVVKNRDKLNHLGFVRINKRKCWEYYRNTVNGCFLFTIYDEDVNVFFSHFKYHIFDNNLNILNFEDTNKFLKNDILNKIKEMREYEVIK